MSAYFDVFINATGMTSKASAQRTVSYSDIRQNWDKVVAHIKIDRVMKPYIELNIDHCGVEMCLQAFQCVHEVLDTEGHVRRLNPRGESDLGNVFESPEGPWKTKCAELRWKWDWQGSVHEYRNNIVKEAAEQTDTSFFQKEKPTGPKPRWRQFTPLVDNDVEQYCTIVCDQKRETLRPQRTYRVYAWGNKTGANAEEEPYRGIFHVDGEPTMREDPMYVSFPPPPLGSMSAAANYFVALPNRDGIASITRWETQVMSKQIQKDILATIEKNYLFYQAKQKTPSVRIRNDEGIEKIRLFEALEAKIENLEPYWLWDARSNENRKKDYRWANWCKNEQKPDGILEVAYRSDDSFGLKKCVVFLEVDGDTEKLRSSKNNNPAKMAVKMMQGSSVMQAVQSESYHIRSNWLNYDHGNVVMSVMENSESQLPNIDEWIKSASVNGLDKSQTVLSQKALWAVTANYHLFLAHAWVAFIIYYKEVKGIDLRENIMEKSNRSTQYDHHFFINFPCNYVEPSIGFQHNWAHKNKDYYEGNTDTQYAGIFHSNVHIKTIPAQAVSNGDCNWTLAPLMATHTKNSNMHNWKAAIKFSQLLLPGAGTRIVVPICGVSIQRVNMSKLCDLIKDVSQKAYDQYRASRQVKQRNSALNSNLKYKRREFPDRWYLTREDQQNRRLWWNMYSEYEGPSTNKLDTDKYNAATAAEYDLQTPKADWGPKTHDVPGLFRAPECRLWDNDSKIDLNYGFEASSRPTSYKNVSVKDLDGKYDQVDLRMYFLDCEMKKKHEWQELIDGVWYYEDIIQFMQTLQNIAKNMNTQWTEDDQDFTCTPEASGLEAHTESMKYRFQLLRIPVNWASTAMTEAKISHCFQHKRDQPDNTGFPEQTPQTDKAYHIYSILCWFFDNRDFGACRLRWEGWLLNYFQNEFVEFKFLPNPKTQDVKQYLYYSQTWFWICHYIEINFRNALATVNVSTCNLSSVETKWAILKGGEGGLQDEIQLAQRRQTRLLQDRSMFEGLQGVSPGLSFLEDDKLSLRNECMAHLNRQLPKLDPELMRYLAKFKVPEIELFLRQIQIPTIIALRELAQRYSKQGSLPDVDAQLQHYAPGLRSEFMAVFDKVQKDDSVYVKASTIPLGERLYLSQSVILRMMQQVLQIEDDLTRVGLTRPTPMHFKFYMMMTGDCGPVFKNLLNAGEFINIAPNRPLLLMLLELLVAKNLMSASDSARKSPANTQNVYSNDTLRAFLKLRFVSQHTSDTLSPDETGVKWDELLSDENKPLEKLYHKRCEDLTELTAMQWKWNMNADSAVEPQVPVFLTFGTSNTTWPCRDSNIIKFKSKSSAHNNFDRLSDSIEFMQTNLGMNLVADKLTEYDFHTESADMTDEEKKKWMLLHLACPKPTQSFNTDKMQVLLENEERTRDHVTVHLAWTDRPSVREYFISQDHDAPLFFEQCPLRHHEDAFDFPAHIQALIPELPSRKQIYIPAVFVPHVYDNLRPLQKYKHRVGGEGSEVVIWQACYVGVRTWAWKRLMIKQLFLHAFTRVLARSREVCALHTPSDHDLASNFKVWRAVDTKDNESTCTAALNLANVMRGNWKRGGRIDEDTYRSWVRQTFPFRRVDCDNHYAVAYDARGHVYELRAYEAYQIIRKKYEDMWFTQTCWNTFNQRDAMAVYDIEDPAVTGNESDHTLHTVFDNFKWGKTLDDCTESDYEQLLTQNVQNNADSTSKLKQFGAWVKRLFTGKDSDNFPDFSKPPRIYIPVTNADLICREYLQLNNSNSVSAARMTALKARDNQKVIQVKLKLFEKQHRSFTNEDTNVTYDGTRVLKMSAVGKQIKWLQHVSARDLFAAWQDQKGVRYLHISNRVKNLFSPFLDNHDSVDVFMNHVILYGKTTRSDKLHEEGCYAYYIHTTELKANVISVNGMCFVKCPAEFAVVALKMDDGSYNSAVVKSGNPLPFFYATLFDTRTYGRFQCSRPDDRHISEEMRQLRSQYLRQKELLQTAVGPFCNTTSSQWLGFQGQNDDLFSWLYGYTNDINSREQSETIPDQVLMNAFELHVQHIDNNQYANLQKELRHEYTKLHQQYASQHDNIIYNTTFFTESAKDSFAYRSPHNSENKLNLRFTLPEVQLPDAYRYTQLTTDPLRNSWSRKRIHDHKECAKRNLIKALYDEDKYKWLQEDLDKVWVESTQSGTTVYEPKSEYVLAWRYLCNMNEFVSTEEDWIRDSTHDILEDDLKSYVQVIRYMLRSRN